MPGQTKNEFTWLGSGFEVDFNELDFEILPESRRSDYHKRCACLGQDPNLLSRVILNRVRCEKSHYILCDQWKSKVVKNSLV